MDVRQLVPAGRTEALSVADLADLYAVPPPRPGRPAWLRLNFVTTLDGSIQGPDGRSGSINNPTDSLVFALQRALADVILAGASTTRAEGYRPASIRAELVPFREAAGLTGDPPIAVVTASGRVNEALLADPASIVLTTTTAAQDLADRAAQVVDCGRDSVDLTAAVKALVSLGYRRITCEGGGTLAGGLTAAGQVDELCLTWAPFLRGGDPQRLLGRHPLASMVALRPASLLMDEAGYLLGRWLVG
jgi:5-amino-6-(5-phosphoribosylamino)uracil reductase